MAKKTKPEGNAIAHAKKAMETAKAQFNEAQAHVKKYMKENPAKAAMIAAGLGAAIGAATVALIMRGKGRKKGGE